MKVLSESRIQLTPAQLDNRTWRERPSTPRSSGVHVGSVVRALGVAAGKLQPWESDEDSFSDTNYPMVPAMGVMWEEFRASCYTEDELIWQPHELERDNIFGTPDGLFIRDVETAIWEAKATTAKLKPIGTCYMYVKQGLSYCAMSGNRRVLYEVNFILGDYTRPYKPVAVQSLVEFTEQECETWWEIVREAAKNVKAEG